MRFHLGTDAFTVPTLGFFAVTGTPDIP
jgi:hypothetical protein